MKPPKNFYSNLDRRKQGLPEVPEASAADAGKIIKVGETGAYELGDDENTIIIPNSDTTPSATLNTLTIGSTTYKVNDARVTKILGLRFTINNGDTYNAKMPIVSFVNEYGEATQAPSYTMTCDKPIQYGRATLDGSAGVLTQYLPAIFTVLFNAEFNIDEFANIKLENSELFPGDIAKNIKLEYSVNGDDWLEIFDKVSIDWTNTIHIYDMSTGEEITTKSPIPEPTAADEGKVLTVDSQGAWGLANKEVVVNMNVPPEGNASFVDKTMDEIITLFNKRIPMIFKHNNNIYLLRSISTQNKSLTLVNYTVTSIRLYLQSISFNSQGVGTILNIGINIS